MVTVKILKIRAPKRFLVNILKFEHSGFTIMRPKDADGMANTEDPHQMTPKGAVCSVSILFAQTCLTRNLK